MIDLQKVKAKWERTWDPNPAWALLWHERGVFVSIIH